MTLDALATSLDATMNDPVTPLLVRMVDHDGELEVAVRCLEGHHPLDHLLGFVAPANWCGLGVRCPARAFRLGAPGRPAPSDVVVTLLIDRDGNGSGLLRDCTAVTPLREPPQGLVGDACRRALHLPTEPAPLSTVELWLRIWLDRLLDGVADAEAGSAASEWPAVVAVHPAAVGLWSSASPTPVMLADAATHLAEAWPWGRLRADPGALDIGFSRDDLKLNLWMDDGMFARWVLAGLPDLRELALAVEHLLPPATVTRIRETLVASGAVWPGPC